MNICLNYQRVIAASIQNQKQLLAQFNSDTSFRYIYNHFNKLFFKLQYLLL